jgi:anti-anti-sigma regulatory factor
MTMTKPKSTRRPKQSPAVAAEGRLAVEVIAVAAAQASPDAGARGTVLLEPGLEIKDVERVRQGLLDALSRATAIIIDVSRVSAIDTAGVQLLLALQNEAANRGITFEFCGESAPLTHAATVLGMREKIRIVMRRD